MKLTIISTWYNEELIAPFFMEHYKDFVDEFNIFVDTDTTDRTVDILKSYKNVNILPITFPHGFDDGIKTNTMNELYKTIKEGWVLCVDSDEFIFTIPYGQGVKNFIADTEEYGYYVIAADLWNVYRHKDDKDLNINSKPIIFQRTHGSKINEHGQLYIKPCLVKAGLDVKWGVGQHVIYGEYEYPPVFIGGAHWCHADPKLLIARHNKNRKDRLSPENIRNNWSYHFLQFTEDHIAKICNDHLNDEEIILK